MSFQDAVRTCLSKYADFNGRARRSEYWWFALFNLIVSIVMDIIDAVIGNSILGLLVSLALLLPGIAVGVRRLHDTSRSGWWILIGLIPIVGWIVLIVFFVQDSHPDNQYGPSPKGYTAAPGGPGFGQPPAPPTGPDYGQAPPSGPDYGQPPAPGGQNPYGT
ncbi:MAG: DUF805 domain-containing protein [Nocardioides sp.]